MSTLNDSVMDTYEIIQQEDARDDQSVTQVSSPGVTSPNIISDEESQNGNTPNAISSDDDENKTQTQQKETEPEPEKVEEKKVEEQKKEELEEEKQEEKKQEKEEQEEKQEDGNEEVEEEDEWIDILGSGQIKKKVVKPGDGDKPEFGHSATIKYSATYSNKIFKEEEITFILGESESLHAFDLCVPTMQVGEVCMLQSSSRFAYGETGYLDIVPPNESVEFEIELLQSQELDLIDMSFATRMDYANKKKDLGDKLFKDKNYDAAIASYSKSLKFLENIPENISSEEKKIFLDVKVKCLNNQVASQMRLDKNVDALRLCDEVISIEPSNTKAYFRKGQILANLNDLEESISNLKKAASLEPSNQTIKEELKKTLEKKKSIEQNEKRIYSMMLRGASEIEINKPSTPTSPTSTPIQSNEEKTVEIKEKEKEKEKEEKEKEKEKEKEIVEQKEENPKKEEIKKEETKEVKKEEVKKEELSKKENKSNESSKKTNENENNSLSFLSKLLQYKLAIGAFLAFIASYLIYRYRSSLTE